MTKQAKFKNLSYVLQNGGINVQKYEAEDSTGWDFRMWALAVFTEWPSGFSYKKMYGRFSGTKK